MPDVDPTVPLFCFGSLMDDDVLRVVTGRDPDGLDIVAADAPGRAQREVVGESYPILVPDAGSRARGRLVGGLDAEALERVLFFEGEEYAIAPLEVEVGGERRPAQYFRDTGVYRTSGGSWDFARWRAAGIDDFLDHTARYMALYGTMSAAEADAVWNARP